MDLLIAMRYFWEDKNGSHFEGLFDPVMRDLAPHGDMLHLARSVAQAGIDARSTLTSQEYSYKEHHKSALEHLDKILEGSWKDAQKGRILYLTSKSDPLLNGVVAVPLGFFKKSFPDRTISQTEGREVVDPAEQNDDVQKDYFHPAPMPKHNELARTITWWVHRYPGIQILLAKKDIADAFKRLWLLTESADLFPTKFKGV